MLPSGDHRSREVMPSDARLGFDGLKGACVTEGCSRFLCSSVFAAHSAAAGLGTRKLPCRRIGLRFASTWTFVLLLSLLPLLATAQSLRYMVYIDGDLNTATGCTATVTGGERFDGADFRLAVTASGNPPMVTSRTLAPCLAGSFANGSSHPLNYPVGLNIGLPLTEGSADVIEMSIRRAELGHPLAQLRVGFAAESESGSSDALFTLDGSIGGPPIAFGIPQLVPTLGFFGALLLALALATLALRALKHNRRLAQMLLIGAFFSAGFAAWAANFKAVC